MPKRKAVRRIIKKDLPDYLQDHSKPRTGKELLEALIANGLVGMWKDRTDIGDSAEFARKLRERAEKR